MVQLILTSNVVQCFMLKINIVHFWNHCNSGRYVPLLTHAQCCNPYVVIDLASFSKAIGMAIWKCMAWSCNVFAQGYGSSKSTTKLIIYFIK